MLPDFHKTQHFLPECYNTICEIKIGLCSLSVKV